MAPPAENRDRGLRRISRTTRWLAGGAVATAFTFWTAQALSSALPIGQIPGINLDFTPDLRVLGWALGLSLLTGLVFGTAPAWQSARIRLIP